MTIVDEVDKQAMRRILANEQEIAVVSGYGRSL